MHLVGFTIEIYYDAWSYKRQKYFFFVHISAPISLIHIINPTNTHLYSYHHFIDTLILQHVLDLKEPSSGRPTETFSQPEQTILYQA